MVTVSYQPTQTGQLHTLRISDGISMELRRCAIMIPTSINSESEEFWKVASPLRSVGWTSKFFENAATWKSRAP